jgi:hypothetical protein
MSCMSFCPALASIFEKSNFFIFAYFQIPPVDRVEGYRVLRKSFEQISILDREYNR